MVQRPPPTELSGLFAVTLSSRTWTRTARFLDVDVAAPGAVGRAEADAGAALPPGWGNAECGFYMLRHAPMLTGA
jgi:hypothetical protein